MYIDESFKNQLLTAILSAPIVYIPHYHYNYVDNVIASLLQDSAETKECNILGLNNNAVYEFDLQRGSVNFNTKQKLKTDLAASEIEALYQLFDLIIKQSTVEIEEKRIFIFKNISSIIIEDAQFQLLLQFFAELYERGGINSLMTIIIVDPMSVSLLPSALSGIITVVEVPLPKMDDIQKIVFDIEVSDQYESTPGKKKGIQEDLCRNLQGLQYYEIEQVLRSAILRSNGKLTERSIQYVLEEKRQIVKKTGIIEVIDTDVSFDSIGGLDVLKEDLKKVAVFFKNLSDVSKYKMPLPKGILIMGMPGCGKSLIAKSIAFEFGVSLLRLDISKLMGQYVGQSEENLRRALATAEAAHPCVLWIDEIEKAFHGANSSNSNDNDMLVMRMMGFFLTWMQERTTAVYIVATANDVMRPEFMRKGRFDEVYYVDFPQEEDICSIFEKHLEPYRKLNLFRFDEFDEKSFSKVAKLMDGFAGSEIASVVNTVMSDKFNILLCLRNDREQELQDMIHSGHTDNQKDIIKAVLVSSDDFETVIKGMHDSVMSRQNNPAIEGIRMLRNQYKFKNASRNVDKDDEISKLREKERVLTHELEEFEIRDRIEKLEISLEDYKKKKQKK